MRTLLVLGVSLLSNVIFSLPAWSQGASSPYLVRMERQTRQEDVCMLVLTNGQFHLERTAAGSARIYEGTLPSASLAELQPLLTVNPLLNLKQNDIGAPAPGEDVDQVMLTISRPTGWQTLVFPNQKTRKPYKTEVDPILKWLDLNKQQEGPVAGAMATRCVPPKTTEAARGLATPNASNPYLMRIVIDHYEPLGGGAAISSVSHGTGTAGQSVGGMTNTEAMDVNSYKITRTCAIVYESGRYRFEKSTREKGSTTKADVYRDTLNKSQLDEMQQILGNPKLAALPNNTPPTVLGYEGDLITLNVLRDKTLQSVGFVSTGPRPASANLRDASMASLTANIGLVNPLRKWVKQNLENSKTGVQKEAAVDSCIPSAQPE